MKVIVLVENVSEGVLGCAHGLSLYAETEKHRILFDAGPDGDLLMRNAAALGVDLSGVDIAVLSHGHYDHARGMAAFLELNTAAKLYLHRLTLRGHFAHEKDGWRNIGLDPELVERFSGRFVLTGDGCVIDEELQLFADIKTRAAVRPTGRLRAFI
jgi:7,8-dihydropterin-6-yl-methyl-4-(beta-D-ribofuranosyl)aminobenzene 5'-phosphate synthase